VALDFERDRAAFTCELPAEALSDELGVQNPAEVRLIGKQTYMRFGKEEKWLASPGEEDDFADLDPRTMLAEMQKSAKEIGVVGHERIDGADTTHYRLVVDAEQAEVVAAEGQTTAVVQLWIDEDSLVRRVHLIDAEGSEDEAAVTIDFSDFGAALDIEAPPADEITKDGDFGVSTASRGPECAHSAEPIGVDAFFAALAEGSEPPIAGPYSCSEGVVTVGHGEALSCSLHPEPVAGPAIERRDTAQGQRLARENVSCTVGGDSPAALRQAEAVLQATHGG
jgi:hypothetical protein